MSDPRDQEVTLPAEPEAPGGGPLSFWGRWSRGRRSRVLVAAVVVLVTVSLFVLADVVASSPETCALCHSMQPWVASWRVSPHGKVECYSCHGTPRPWYQEPLSVLERWYRLIGYARIPQSDRSVETTPGSPGISTQVPDWICEQCHDASRVGTTRFAVLIQHKKHAQRNNSCISCHRFTAHPASNRERDVAMMAQCFTCHGQTKGSKAPGRCDLCHLKDFDLKPPSHKKSDWLSVHGQIALVDRQQCVMCHAAEFCVKCHGVVMPHPKGWAKGPNLHAKVAKQDLKVCEKCHKGSTNLCSMCHHGGFDAKKGPWVKQHSVMAGQTGPAFCFGCHDSVFCDPCHSAGRPADGGSP